MLARWEPFVQFQFVCDRAFVLELADAGRSVDARWVQSQETWVWGTLGISTSSENHNFVLLSFWEVKVSFTSPLRMIILGLLGFPVS